MIRIVFFLSLVFLFFNNDLSSQSFSYGEKINRIVTPLTVFQDGVEYKATGFYYMELEQDSLRYSEMHNLYLISNRHVLFPNERLPDSVHFSVLGYKKISKPNFLEYDFIDYTLDIDYLRDSLLLDLNTDIDVAAINIFQLIEKSLYRGMIKLPFFASSKRNKISLEDMPPEIGDRVMIIGYPYGFYDELNKIPIAKSGIISSFYGPDFNGDPKFLIDSKLYKSFSGSIVVASPDQVKVKDGEMVFYKDKPVIFLGIYSGEKYVVDEKISETDDVILRRKIKMDLGNVWYPKTISNLIKRKHNYIIPR